jgi:Domain of Unknown Function (DUF1080)
MTRAVLLFFVAAAFPQEPAWKSMFDGQSLKGWKETPFTRKGEVKVQDGCIVIGKGYMTGVTYTDTLPKTNYEVRMEAQRVDGHDFFAGITFPVNDSFITWINGGWGGSMVGLSSLDGNDASENETSTSRDFQTGRWYGLWLAVTPGRIRTWIDEQPVIDVQIANREVGLRPGETDLSKPFGIATYNTTSKIRKIEWRPLPKQ